MWAWCLEPVDQKKIEKLQAGEMPIYEPGLEELVKRNVGYGRLSFTTDLTSVLDEVEVVFSAVGTPPDEDGSADLKYVYYFSDKINSSGRYCKKSKSSYSGRIGQAWSECGI